MLFISISKSLVQINQTVVKLRLLIVPCPEGGGGYRIPALKSGWSITNIEGSQVNNVNDKLLIKALCSTFSDDRVCLSRDFLYKGAGNTILILLIIRIIL